MGNIINLETSGQTFERNAVLLGMYLDDKRQQYTIEFEEQLFIDGEMVSRKQHRITESGDKWEEWNSTLGTVIRPLLEADIANYFTPIVEEIEDEEPVIEEPIIEEPPIEESI